MNIRAAFQRPDLRVHEPPEAAWVVMGSYPSSLTRPTFNQSEADYQNRAGLNIYSDEGQGFRNAILHGAGPGTVTPQRQVLQVARTSTERGPGVAHIGGRALTLRAARSRGTADARGVVIREMTALRREPFGQHNGYQDFFGAFLARVATVIAVVPAVRYQGQLPMRLQPRVQKPDPWNDPTRGKP